MEDISVRNGSAMYLSHSKVRTLLCILQFVLSDAVMRAHGIHVMSPCAWRFCYQHRQHLPAGAVAVRTRAEDGETTLRGECICSEDRMQAQRRP